MKNKMALKIELRKLVEKMAQPQLFHVLMADMKLERELRAQLAGAL
jgi:hypothetical protein